MEPNALGHDGRQSSNTPLVSVIVPAFNVAPFIRETLDSVLAQSFADYEVIVINDGSPDTEELEKVLKSYRDQIIYIKQENQGAGAARNAGLRVARGMYVAFLDGDDIWLPDFLAEQIALIKSASGFDLVYADAINFGDPVFTGRTSMETNPSKGQVTFEKLLCGECNIITSAVVARREPIMRVGLFDVNFPNSQDFDLWLRLARDARARITYQHKILLRRRIYEGSLASDEVKSLDGELRVLQKMGSRSDLTREEREILEQTIALRKATMEVVKGKRRLAEGDFSLALKCFELANDYFHSWKLRLVLFSLRRAPRVLQQVYRLRPT